jgi:hypothetical protein
MRGSMASIGQGNCVLIFCENDHIVRVPLNSKLYFTNLIVKN